LFLILVTDVCTHPRRLDTIISASEDGTVRGFDCNNASSPEARAAIQEEEEEYLFANSTGDGGSRYKDYYFPVLHSEPGSILSVDCDNSGEACMMLTTSETGIISRTAI
jgi:WD40 repeat protein